MKYLILFLIACMGINMLLAFDLSDPWDYLDAFMRIRGDAEGGETVYHWTGKVYSLIPGEKRMELFAFEGFNIARTVVKEDGFELLTREAAFYKDHRTGQILQSWRNPFTGKEVPVIQVWNDPVNQDFSFGDDEIRVIRMILPSTELGDELAFHLEIFPYYTSPLPRKEYPQFSQSDIYQAAEFFQFFAKKEDLADKELSSVPAHITWTRISPWLPFMRMDDRPGNLVFVCRGRKLEGGFEALPQQIQDFVLANKPEFASAPLEWSEPNETSWTYFRKLLEAGLIEP